MYIFAGDVYVAFEQWALASATYGKAELYVEATACAEKISETKNFTIEILRKQLLVKEKRTSDALRMFFFYAAEKSYHQIAAQLLEKIADTLTDVEIKLVCQGGYKILVDSDNVSRLAWNNFDYSLHGVQEIIAVLKQVGKNDQPFELPEIEIPIPKPCLDDNMIQGELTLFKTAEAYGFIDGDIYFRLEQVEDKKLRTALNSNGLWRNNIKVKYLLGKDKDGMRTAADHVLLVEGESLPPENVEIHEGIIESYDANIDFGKVSDNKTYDEYGFKLDAVKDPCLHRYLQDAFYASYLQIQFTLKFYKDKEVVRYLRLTDDERIKLNEKYGLTEPTAPPSLTDEMAKNLPEYQSLPPLPHDKIKVTRASKFRQAEKTVSPVPYHKPRSSGKIAAYKDGCKYFAEKRWAEAAACFEESVSDENFWEKSLRTLLTIYKVDYGENLEAQIEKGLKLLEKYEARLDKNSVINERIQLLDKAKRQDELIAELLKGIKSASKTNQRLHFRLQLARQYWLKSDYEAAKNCYEEWLKEKNRTHYLPMQINTIELRVKQNLAICLYYIGDKTRAKEIATELLERNADNQTVRDILNNELELQNENTNSDELYNVFFEGNALSPYAKDRLEKIQLQSTYSTTYHRLLKNNYSQNFVGDDFIGTPEEARDIKEKVTDQLATASNEVRSAAWAFISKLTLNVYKKYSAEYERCDKNRVNLSSANDYVAQFMGYAGDYELQRQLDCNVDVVRFFYIEEMSTASKKSDLDTRSYFIKFIVSFFRKPYEVSKLQPSTRNKDKDAHLSCLKNDVESREARKLLIATFFLPDNLPDNLQKRISEFIDEMSAHLSWRNEAAELFGKLLPEKNIRLTENNFKEFWQKAKESHLKNMRKFEQTLHDAAKNYDKNCDNGFGSCLEKINAMLNSDVLSKTDTERVSSYCKLLSILNKIAEKTTFEEKESDYREVIEDSETFEKKVFEKPTKLSYEILGKNLKDIKFQAEKELKKLYESSVPNLTITTTIIGSEPVQFIVDITNKENCQTAINLKVDVEGMGDNLEIKTASNNKISAVRGGSHSEFLYETILGNKEKSQGYLEVKIKVSYTYRIDRDNTTEGFIERTDNLSLLKSEDYEEIDNIYASINRSNGVPSGSNLFYGRDEDINKIVNMLKLRDGSLMKHRGIYMYGQKRAGKTSIMNHLKKKICDTYGQNAYLIISVGSVGECHSSLFRFFASIIYHLEVAIQRDHKKLYQFLQHEGVEFPYGEIECNPSDDAKYGIFQRTLKKVIEKSREFGDSENKFIPLFLIDEFTYFYQWLEEKSISASFMQFWKAFLENNPICTIIIGMDHMPQFVAEYPNEFECMLPFPVSFLKENYTKDLANKPILLQDGSSRYKNKAGEEALSYIYRLTAGSAYLTVIFCNAFVDYLNERKTTYITKTVIDNFIREKLFGKTPVLTEITFDPQLNDTGKFYPEKKAIDDDNKTVLTYIALHADSASRELSLEKMNCIDELSEKNEKRLTEILDRLTQRGVLTRRSTYYKIEIDLLRMWLLRECGKEF